MNKFHLVLILLIATTTSAYASDYTVDFSISGLVVNGQAETSLEIDLDLGQRYIGVHGALNYANGLSSPATGSCFFTSAGGVFCNLQIDQYSYTLDVGANLNGTILAKNQLGNTVGQGSVFLSALE